MANSNSEVSRELKNKIYAFRVLYGNLLKKAHGILFKQNLLLHLGEALAKLIQSDVQPTQSCLNMHDN